MLYLLDIYEMASTATLHIAIASYYYILSLCFKTSIYEVFNVNVIPDQRLLYYCLSLNLKIFVLFCFADYIYRKSCFINNDVNTSGRKKKFELKWLIVSWHFCDRSNQLMWRNLSNGKYHITFQQNGWS